MKQIYIQIKTPGNIKDVDQANNSSIFNRKSIGNANLITPQSGGTEERLLRQGRGLNIFLTQNKGKGPPGRQRSPGVGDSLFPEHPPNAKKEVILNLFQDLPTREDKSPIPVNRDGVINSTFDNKIHTEQTFYNTHKLNFYLQTLIFTNMKKQILFLAFFILAVFAGMNKSYGQDLNYLPATNCAPVTPLPCATDDALHPLVGKTYTYNVTVAPNTSDYVQWFVYNATTATSVITAGVLASASAEPNTGASPYLMNATGAFYNSTTNTTTSIDVKWQSFDGVANKILLVAYVKGASGCSDNIEVFRIQPSFAFSLDIAGLLPTGALPAVGNNAVECLSPVQKATYDAVADRLTMDYGENYIFFSVTAANFVNSWKPAFSVVSSSLQTAPAVADITWAYPAQAILAAGTWNAAATPVLAQTPPLGSIGGTGECIIVRVHLDHGNNENDAATLTRNVVIGVNGIMYNVATSDYSNVALTDVDPSAAGSACTQTATDQATYDLTSRPAITTTVTPAPGFVPKN